MYQNFKFITDDAGNIGFWLPICSNTYTATLTINTDTLFTVPGGLPPTSAGTQGNFGAVITHTDGAEIYMALGAIAAVPAGASFAASTSKLLNTTFPELVIVSTGDVLHFICASASKSVCVALYPL